MKMEWQNKRLKDMTTKIGSGATPRGGQSSYKSNGTPLIRSLNVYDLHFDRNGLAFIDDNQAKQLSNVEVREGDVLLNITGASVCRCTSVPNDLVPARVNQHVSIIRPDGRNLDGKYLKYILVSFPYKKQLLGLATTGATREALTKTDIENFEIKLPSIEAQSRIASVLSTYDDLIEVNEKRIKALEEMAQRLYIEWFVKFKFPGHEKARMMDSGTKFGLIPEGWEIVKIGNMFCIVLGGTPSRVKKDYWRDGNIAWINSGAVNQLRIIEESEMITEEALKKSATKMMPQRTTLLAITGATLGQVSLTEIECCANQSVIGIYDREGLFNEYLYLKIKEIIKNIIALAGGGAQQHINKDIVNNTEIFIPDIKLIKIFLNKIKPVFDAISFLIFQNKNLQKTRDLLIPQLVTGKRELK
jgi:type I restriction enzyme S subunit